MQLWPQQTMSRGPAFGPVLFSELQSLVHSRSTQVDSSYMRLKYLDMWRRRIDKKFFIHPLGSGTTRSMKRNTANLQSNPQAKVLCPVESLTQKYTLEWSSIFLGLRERREICINRQGLSLANLKKAAISSNVKDAFPHHIDWCISQCLQTTYHLCSSHDALAHASAWWCFESCLSFLFIFLRFQVLSISVFKSMVVGCLISHWDEALIVSLWFHAVSATSATSSSRTQHRTVQYLKSKLSKPESTV